MTGATANPATVDFRFLLEQVWGEPRDLKLSAEEMAARRDTRVREIVRFAFQRVPWYERAMRDRGLVPDDVRTAEDLSLLPIVEPTDLSRDGDAFLPRGADRKRLLALQTSGTTMVSRTVYHDDEGLVAGWSVMLRERVARESHLQGNVRRYRSASLTLDGNPIRVNERFRQSVPAVWKLAPEERRISVFEDLDRVVGELREWQPRVLEGYGSAVGRLFRHLATGVDMPLPEVVTFGSDSMTAAERAIIERDFGIPVLGVYLATEAIAMGYECGRGEGYHVHEDVSVVRIVDEEGRGTAPGEPGSLLVSNLVNRGTVLLNYRLGDVAAWIDGACPCGRPLPRIRLLDGRETTFIERQGKPPIHQFRLYKRLQATGIARWQVVQTGATEFVARLIPSPGQDRAKLAEEVRASMTALIGPEIRVDVVFPSDLQREPSGKTLSFVRWTDEPPSAQGAVNS